MVVKIMAVENIQQKYLINNNIEKKEGIKDKIVKQAPLIGSLLGSIAPVAIISLARKNKLSFDVFESGNLAKDLATIVTVGTGGVLGGLAGAMTQENSKEDKEAKYKESFFHILTVAIPAAIATGILAMAKKTNYKGILDKVFAPILGVGIGMPVAQHFANLFDKKVLNKNNPNYKPHDKLQLKDYIVHVDDILSIMVISKIPFVNKIHADKILPLIYAYNGYESASAKAKD